jgi:hypothetical protein
MKMLGAASDADAPGEAVAAIAGELAKVSGAARPRTMADSVINRLVRFTNREERRIMCASPCLVVGAAVPRLPVPLAPILWIVDMSFTLRVRSESRRVEAGRWGGGGAPFR